MASVLDSLKSVSSYPIPSATIETMASLRGLRLDWDISSQEKEFLLTKADLLMWLSLAPNISQEGISYSFTDNQRASYASLAKSITSNYEDELPKQVKFGYKGSRR